MVGKGLPILMELVLQGGRQLGSDKTFPGTVYSNSSTQSDYLSHFADTVGAFNLKEKDLAIQLLIFNAVSSMENENVKEKARQEP